MRKSLWQKQIPTILGVGVLVIALIIGTVAFTMQGGPSVFAPRASSEETPKKIKVTNVADTSFTISFFTDGKTAGFIKYGTEEKSLKSQASDDRDQLTGNISSYNLHHITIRGLTPATSYFYVLGTGSNKEIFDNAGAAFKITTGKKTGSPPAAKTAYGTVLEASGGPAEGAIVYLSTDGAGEMSSLVKNSGSWAIPLSTARVPDGSSFAKLTDDQTITITVQGNAANNTTSLTTTVAKSQPVASINLTGSSQVAAASPSASVSDEVTAVTPVETRAVETTSEMVAPSVASGASSLGSLASLTSASSSAVATGSSVVDVSKKDTKPITVTTDQPVIKGTAPANIEITIEVHSDTNISQTVTSDSAGAYALDIAKLSENLEPGEHTVTIKYTDPTTGKLVTTTKTFNVAPQSTSATKTGTSNTTTKLALAKSPSPSPRTSTGPYGTGNPYATTSSKVSTSSSRVSYPSTRSGIPTSGSVGTTFALIIGGMFFIISGLWSFWIANQLQEEKEIAA